MGGKRKLDDPKRKTLDKKESTYIKPSTKKNKPVDIVKGSPTSPTYSACWVAREVYGADNPQWLVFRDWLLKSAPSWFRALYGRYGERFARFISDKPRLKAIIRKGMDKAIEKRVWIEGHVWSVSR